jgi:RND superfamily putative drug exporter
LKETAVPATAAAAVMVAAVIPFVFSGLFNLRLTISLAVVLVLEALIVRPVLLPAAVELLGRRGWWPTKPAEPSAPAAAEPPPPTPLFEPKKAPAAH